MKNFKTKTIVFFDVETTGLSSAYGDKIIEIAALKTKNLKPIDTFNSLVNPQRDISFEAFQVNRISQDMVDDAPTARDVLPDFLKFIKGAVLVGHNVKFDLGFINNELSFIGKKINAKAVIIDTLKMSRGLCPTLGRYALWIVAQSLGIKREQEHRALTDVQLDFDVFLKLIEIAKDKKIDDLNAIVSMFGNGQGLSKKHTVKKLALISEAIASNKKLKLNYFSGRSASASVRQVTPKRIVQNSDKTMLIGYCHLRKEERGFRIDRILDLKKA